LYNAILLLEELHEFLVTGIGLLHNSIGLVFCHRSMAMDRTTFKRQVNSIRLELIDECPELTEEVVNDSVLASGKSTASTMGCVHKIDAEDGHRTIIT
jgi:hypothetical protein